MIYGSFDLAWEDCKLYGTKCVFKFMMSLLDNFQDDSETSAVTIDCEKKYCLKTPR